MLRVPQLVPTEVTPDAALCPRWREHRTPRPVPRGGRLQRVREGPSWFRFTLMAHSQAEPARAGPSARRPPRKPGVLRPVYRLLSEDVRVSVNCSLV